MYLPYVRGKQFELLALRELSSAMAHSGSISPIIEPVKQRTSSLERCLTELIGSNVNFTLVLNPDEGELKEKYSVVKGVIDSFGGYTNFQIGIIVKSVDSFLEVRQFIEANDLSAHSFALIHNEEFVSQERLVDFSKSFIVRFNIVNYGRIGGRRYHRNFLAETLVALEDQFREKQRNVDYLQNPEEPFSEEYRFFAEDSYAGYSDFASIGERFSDGGFLPFAVAIHLTFERANAIWIRHFVSDTNDDNTDVPGKFAEALAHMITWLNANPHLNSTAVQEFQHLHANQHYPGLGTLKKLSLKHHIELNIHLLDH